MSEQKSNQLSDHEYEMYVAYAKYDPYLVRLCSKCGMEESACICSNYDSEGNEL